MTINKWRDQWFEWGVVFLKLIDTFFSFLRFFEWVIKSNMRRRSWSFLPILHSKIGKRVRSNKSFTIPSCKASILTRYVIVVFHVTVWQPWGPLPWRPKGVKPCLGSVRKVGVGGNRHGCYLKKWPLNDTWIIQRLAWQNQWGKGRGGGGATTGTDACWKFSK